MNFICPIPSHSAEKTVSFLPTVGEVQWLTLEFEEGPKIRVSTPDLHFIFCHDFRVPKHLEEALLGKELKCISDAEPDRYATVSATDSPQGNDHNVYCLLWEIIYPHLKKEEGEHNVKM